MHRQVVCIAMCVLCFFSGPIEGLSNYTLCDATSLSEPCCTCPQNNDTILCRERCPNGFFNNSDPAIPCYSPTITTTMTTDSTNESLTTEPITTTATVQKSVVCSKCHESCSNCTGNSKDCIQCARGYERVNDSKSCTKIKSPSTETNLAAIIGGTVGGFVFLVLVILLIFFLCRRRQRRNRFPDRPAKVEQNIERISAVNILAEPNTPEVDLNKGKQPDYSNIEFSPPRPKAIEQSHDKILRYTKDPTNKNKPSATRTMLSEDEELKVLPIAPLPPLDTYEDVEEKPSGATPQPQRTKVQQPNRTKTIEAIKKVAEDKRRRTDTPARPNLVAESCPELPGLRIEREERVKQERVNKVKSLVQEPEANYENIQAKKPSNSNLQSRRVPLPLENDDDDDVDKEEDPQDDYVNVGPKEEETPHQTHRIVEGADGPSELEVEYINQGAVGHYHSMSGLIKDDHDTPFPCKPIEHAYLNIN